MNAVVRSAASESEAASLIAVIQRAATDPNCDIDKMERLLQMQERIVARNAKAAYAEALATMQPELPIIGERGGIKDRSGNIQSRYALWEDIVGVITPILARYGFSLSFRTASDDKCITVTGVLLHAMGHSESTQLTLPADQSGSKNAVQAIGSSTSYGKRYTSAALLNLRTGETDDDGHGAQKTEVISESQLADLTALMDEVGANKHQFLRFLKIDDLAKLPVSGFDHAVSALRQKGKARTAK